MKTVSIFKNGKNQAIRLPTNREFEDISELEITKEGNTIVLRPSRPNWLSLKDVEKSDDDFLSERSDIVSDEEGFTL